MRRAPLPSYVGVMSLRTRFFAMTYDRQMAKTEKAGLRAFRERLLAGASGDVLEIGGGTGANLPWYGPAVTSLTITEPQPRCCAAWRPASATAAPAPRCSAPRRGPAHRDDSFDVAVSTPGPVRGRRPAPGAARAAPGAASRRPPAVHRAPAIRDPGTARLQDRLNWLNRLVVCCDCNSPHARLHPRRRLHRYQVEHTELPKAPPFVRPPSWAALRFPAAAPRAPQDGARPTVAPSPVARPAG
jgi:hypothetical protein